MESILPSSIIATLAASPTDPTSLSDLLPSPTFASDAGMPAETGGVYYDADDPFFFFEASKLLPIILAGTFFGFMLVHIGLSIHYKSKYMIPFVLGCACEAAGYALRRQTLEMVTRSEGLSWYLAQTLCVILAPSFFALSLFLAIPALFAETDSSLSPIRPKLIMGVFIGAEVIVSAALAAGGALNTSLDDGLYELSKTVTFVGFVAQVVVLVAFAVFCGVMHNRFRKAKEVHGPWIGFFLMMYLASVLLIIRAAFRAIQTLPGMTGPGLLTEKELYYDLFEPLPNGILVIAFFLSHPSLFIQRTYTLDPRLSVVVGNNNNNGPRTKSILMNGTPYGASADDRRDSIATSISQYSMSSRPLTATASYFQPSHRTRSSLAGINTVRARRPSSLTSSPGASVLQIAMLPGGTPEEDVTAQDQMRWWDGTESSVGRSRRESLATTAAGTQYSYGRSPFEPPLPTAYGLAQGRESHMYAESVVIEPDQGYWDPARDGVARYYAVNHGIGQAI